MFKRLTLIALVAAAFAVPATATAATAEQVLPSSESADETSGARALTAALPHVVEAQSSGFDWEDAAIGAAGMLSLVVLAGGAMTIVRRSHKPAPIG